LLSTETVSLQNIAQIPSTKSVCCRKHWWVQYTTADPSDFRIFDPTKVYNSLGVIPNKHLQLYFFPSSKKGKNFFHFVKQGNASANILVGVEIRAKEVNTGIMKDDDLLLFTQSYYLVIFLNMQTLLLLTKKCGKLKKICMNFYPN
jgi:hypothetical protein